MKRLSFLAVTTALIFAMTNSAIAALVNRGGGLIYDTDLNASDYPQLSKLLIFIDCPKLGV